ncbi:MAG: SH3 domain-containing protein, partial [Patescibacteria group bacterium]|nr:SH3 domain-containing protein [Patescibacteria group bacterium]
MPKILLTWLITLLFGLSVVSVFASKPVSAAEIVERDALNFDETLADRESNMYGPVTKIAMAEISPPEGIQYGDADEWVKGFFFYSITKLGFADIPFNYVVSWQGDIYNTKSGCEGVLPLVSWVDSDEVGKAVLVGYFNNNREITNAGNNAVKDVVSYLMGLNGLDQDDIIAVDVFLSERTEEVELGSLVLKNSTSNSWRNFVDELRGVVAPEDVAVTREFKGSIKTIDLPQQVKGGQNFVAKVEAVNDGNSPWYNYGEAALYIATSGERGRASDLFLTDKWASFSRVISMNEEWVLPGETATFEFEINTPLIPGDYSEKFELLRLPDRWLAGTQFIISFTVQAGDYVIVEVLETDTGSLNVRSCPSTGCDELGQVTPGDFLINQGKEGAWYKVLWNGVDEG